MHSKYGKKKGNILDLFWIFPLFCGLAVYQIRVEVFGFFNKWLKVLKIIWNLFTNKWSVLHLLLLLLKSPFLEVTEDDWLLLLGTACITILICTSKIVYADKYSWACDLFLQSKCCGQIGVEAWMVICWLTACRVVITLWTLRRIKGRLSYIVHWRLAYSHLHSCSGAPSAHMRDGTFVLLITLHLAVNKSIPAL